MKKSTKKKSVLEKFVLYILGVLAELIKILFKYTIGSFISLSIYFLYGYWLGIIVKYAFGGLFIKGISEIMNTNMTLDSIPIIFGSISLLGVLLNLRLMKREEE